MQGAALHRFELNGKRYAIDPETCFCFECDEICWDVLALYPQATISRIVHELKQKHAEREVYEVVGELEWLRNVKSILPRPTPEELHRRYEIEQGLKRLTVELPGEPAGEPAPEKAGWFRKGRSGPPAGDSSIGRDAAQLLLNRSGNQKTLELEFLERGRIRDVERVAGLCADALRAARLAGKELTAAVRIQEVSLAPLPDALQGHSISARLELTEPATARDALKPLAAGKAFTLAQLAKALQPGGGDARGRIIVRPDTPDFGGVVQALDEAGFKVIELDLDATFVAHPELPPAAMLPALSASAVYYARRLLEGHYFRLDPIASLFYRIYEGQPIQRADPIGANELGIDANGDVFASWRVFGNERFRHGSLRDAALDEAAIKRYEDMGVPTTGPCLRCWARHLCGGGRAAVHDALNGNFHQPHESWCDAQRSWMAAAVSAFNVLSAEGVNFTRIYQTLTPASGKRPGLSMFAMLRAAMSLSIRMRPVEESDAKLLVRWENWNPASYFLFNEKGAFVATRYEREMDALHPQTLDQELVLVRKDGTPFGLLKVRPEKGLETASAWLYFRNEADYASADVRKGLAFLLKQAGQQQGLRRITVAAAEYEEPLQRFLEQCGFTREGTLREALYLHGVYRDVHIYGVTTSTL